MMDLKEIRTKIDAIDDQIIELLIQRYDLVLNVKSYKKNHHLPVLDRSREANIYHKLESQKYSQELKDIYKLIMDLSKNMQQ